MLKKISRLIYILFIYASISNFTLGQGLAISSGATFTLGGSAVFSLSNNWSNAGTFTPSSSTVDFTGTAGNNQTITNTNGETFYNLTVSKSTAVVQIMNNMSVTNQLTISSGGLDLNGKILFLGTTGTLSETAGNTVIGASGTISADNTNLNAPSSYNMGQLGAVITSSVNMGNTTIKRGNYALSGAGGSVSIKRYYDIAPTINTGLNATFVFYYDDSELNGLTESTLKLYRSTDNGVTWTEMGGTVNTTNNTVTLTNIDAFSLWTLGSTNSPLPVELISFSGGQKENKVILNWETETEINNYGFEVQRSVLSEKKSDFKKIGFIKGNGNTNIVHKYSFTDTDLLNGKTFYYRLKQLDNDGKFKYSDILTINLLLPDKPELMQNSPNPFNPSTSIKYFIPIVSYVTIEIYDLLGRKVRTLINKKDNPGFHIVFWNGKDNYGNKASSGIYLYRIITDNFVKTKKMVLLK